MNNIFLKETRFNILKLFLFTLAAFCFNPIFAQNQANYWYFGSNLGLNFNGGPAALSPTAFPLADDDEGEGFSTISDDNGNLLFHTNGMKIWDKNLTLMQNGTGLTGHTSATQCATIFQVPGQTVASNKARYIVITTPWGQDISSGIRYSIVTLDSAAYPTGAVTNVKNVLLPSCPGMISEALISCPHFNGNDVWVVGHDKGGASATNFYAWKVSANGTGNVKISAPVVSNIGNASIATGTSQGIAVMKFNSCFNRIALNYYDSPIVQGFSFDNTTGVVSNWPAPVNAVLKLDNSKTINSNTGDAAGLNYGLEFSPNGQYLFTTQTGEGTAKHRIYRYDLNAGTQSQTDIENSRAALFTSDGDFTSNHRLGHLQLASNGKIYATHYWRTYASGGAFARIDVINTPNNAAHGYTANVFTTWSGTQRSSMGLPSFHKGFLAGSSSLSAADSSGTTSVKDLGDICVGQAFKFDNTYSGVGTNYTWDMNSPSGTAPNVAITNGGATAYHKYTTAGTYKVVTTVKDATCNYTVKDTSIITVNPLIKPNPTVSCSSPNINFGLASPNASHSYVWYNDAALTQPFALGTTSTKPYGTATVYVKEYTTASTSSVMTDPGSAAIPAATTSISTGLISPGCCFENANVAKTTTLTVSKSLTLNSFKFTINGDNYTAGTATFSISLKNTASTFTQSYSVTGGLSKGIGVLGASTDGTAGGTGVRVFTVNTATLTLPADTYTISIILTSTASTGTGTPAVSDAQIEKYSTTLTTPSISGFITNSGASPSGTYIHDINVTTPAVAAVPATYTTVYNTTSLACSYVTSLTVNCILPVEFLYVNASPNRVITWATAKEVNNDFFIVERSIDGKTFTEIARVNGSGTTSSVSSYSYTDLENQNVDVYYRIVQVDYNGRMAYSNVVSVASRNDNAISIYPNPNNGIFSIRINQKMDTNVKLEVLNVLGNVVYLNELESGSQLIQLNLSHLAKGTYFIRASNDSSSSINKLVID